ncbi:hypothetical protein MIR68_004718 [Amoeboaphelidium protococcarum]|nr:hypothetical protein MIR68_004718 [Amoeboaphelidium protococcarum]
MKSVIYSALVALVATVSAHPSKPQEIGDVTVHFTTYASKDCTGQPSGPYKPIVAVVGHCVSYGDSSLKVTQKAGCPDEYVAEIFSKNGCVLAPLSSASYPILPGVYNAKTPGQCMSNGHFSSQMSFVLSAADN